MHCYLFYLPGICCLVFGHLLFRVEDPSITYSEKEVIKTSFNLPSFQAYMPGTFLDTDLTTVSKRDLGLALT